MEFYFKAQSNVCLPWFHSCVSSVPGTHGPEWVVLGPAEWWLCFLEKVARNFPDSERLIKWKVFYICEVTFHLLHVTLKGQRLTFCLGPCLDWISASKSPAYRRIWDFFPSPISSVLFCVNSSCRSNIDKYSRECSSGRCMLPKHFLTIFGKNWSFCVFQTVWKRRGGCRYNGSDIIHYCPHWSAFSLQPG